MVEHPKQLLTQGLHPNIWLKNDREDLTTSAPQKLWRYIIDALQDRGFINILINQEPTITGMAIGDTGTTQGRLLAENYPQKAENPLKILGIILIVIGALMTVIGLLLLIQSFQISFSLDNMLLPLIILIIGIVLIAIGKALLKDKFLSNVIDISLKGEVYGSDAKLSGLGASGAAATGRRSIVSDIRLVTMATCIISRNEGDGYRHIMQSKSSSKLDSDFNGIIQYIHNNIRPTLELDTVRDQQVVGTQMTAPQQPVHQPIPPPSPYTEVETTPQFAEGGLYNEPPPPPPPSQNCSFCGGNLRFIEQYKRMYCDRCGRYL